MKEEESLGELVEKVRFQAALIEKLAVEVQKNLEKIVEKLR
ncbi:MAG: hypothetical protein QXS32_08445 [Candidatus Nezhaarchaeales archaeon]